MNFIFPSQNCDVLYRTNPGGRGTRQDRNLCTNKSPVHDIRRAGSIWGQRHERYARTELQKVYFFYVAKSFRAFEEEGRETSRPPYLNSILQVVLLQPILRTD